MRETLAVKYRPKSFRDVVGQGFTTSILQSQIKNKTFKNAYLFCGPSGCGKALVDDTPVLTLGGWKSIGSLTLKDRIYSFDGKDYEIQGIFPQGEKMCYKIYFKNDDPIECSEDHLWVYKRRNVAQDIKTPQCNNVLDMIKDLDKFGSLIISNCQPIIYKKGRPQKLPAVINGFLFRFLEIDDDGDYYFTYVEDIPENLKQLFGVYEIEVYQKYEDNPARKYIKDKTNSGNISKFISLHKKATSYERKLEKAILYGSVENRIAFIRGFFFIKNQFKTSRQLLSFASSNINLIISMKELVSSLGGSLVYNVEYESAYNSKVYRIYIQFSDVILYKMKFINKIEDKPKRSLNHIITKIEKIGMKKCTCISVGSPDSLFLVKGFIPTHNTTVARIFAKDINLNNGAPIELDAASNNSVEDVRNIIKESYYKSLESEYKVFILDEAHNLTKQAFEAFLKTLEEPPEKSIFIFCTTEPHKIPPTIQNRLQRFDFNRMTVKQIEEKLNDIIALENVSEKVESDAISFIAKISNGGMRDAIANLDKCLSFTQNKLDVNTCASILSMVNYEILIDFIDNIYDVEKVLKIINDLYLKGVDLKQFINQIIFFLLQLCKMSYLPDDLIELPNTYIKIVKNKKIDAKSFPVVIKLLNDFIELKNNIIYESSPKQIIECFLLDVQKYNNKESI